MYIIHIHVHTVYTHIYQYAHTYSQVCDVLTYICPGTHMHPLIDAVPISKSAKRNQKRRERKKAAASTSQKETSSVCEVVKKESPPPPPVIVDPIAELKRLIEEAKAAKVTC